uniref:Uncharacterized protein LOC111119411 n=1 Tax=Crassostrea virginica TaxID=6565 RepID=A0A8B8CJB6_CRAVI|nr:uncharacterized protein LOC111119411 [Crassostrea virginica]
MFHTSMVMTDDNKELDSIQNEKTLFRSLSNTFRSVITPSWLTGLVKTVKETAKAEDTVPTKKEFEEMEVAANFHSSNLHQKSLGQLPIMGDKAIQQRQETLNDIPLQHFSSQKVVHNYEESSDTSMRKNGSSDAGNVLQSNNSGFCPPYKKICNAKSRNFHQSPFYSGKTRFGGAMSSQRMNNSVQLGSLSSNKVPYVVRHKIKARERMRTSTSSAKKILETLHKIRPSYDVPVDFGNGKAEFTLPAESIARLSHGLFDEKHETPVKTKDSGFTFSTPAEKQDVSKDTHLLPKMEFTFSSPIKVIPANLSNLHGR